MKLLFVHEHLGEFGGAEGYVELAARELRRRGHTPSLLFQRHTGRGEANWLSHFEQCFSWPDSPTSEWMEAALETAAPEVIFLHNFSDLKGLEWLLNSGCPVVKMVHDHSLYCLRTYKYNYFTRNICRRPLSGYCVFPCLGSLARDRQSPLGVKWASLSEKQSELELTRECAAVLTYSDYVKQELVSNGFEPSRIFLSSPMRTHGAEQTGSSFTDDNLILFAGQVIRGKGVDALLKALALVQKPFRAIILGQGSHRSHCEKLCRRLGLQEKVAFEGYVLPNRLREYYARASVFVMSSLWPEPFGMAGPEAMRHGLPVVAFDAGGIKEWLHDGVNGFLIPWMDTARFASRLDELLSDKVLARKMGEQARESVRTLDAGRQIDHLEAVLKSVCPAVAPAMDNSLAKEPPFSICL